MLEQIKAEVCQANLDLVAHGLVTLTWGNASALSEDGRHVVIKPSGVPYDQMLPEHMAVVDLEGKLVEGDLRPSSDTATHLILYQHFPECVASRIHIACRPPPLPRPVARFRVWALHTPIISMVACR